LLIDEFLCGFVKLVNVIAEVLGSCKFEQICVEGWHAWLNVVEQKGLHQVASVNSNWNLLEKFSYGQVLGSDLLLDEVNLLIYYLGILL
jgi:hypothetical protein